MSQPFSRYLHPFEVAHNPSLEPEVKRSILASWASDRAAVRNHPGLRKPPGARRASHPRRQPSGCRWRTAGVENPDPALSGRRR